jgi:Carboxypeptidase regulatory-like domain/TonB-dependent Receptor Plug Domain
MKRPIGLVLALLLGAVPMLWAQASTGTIYGSVADASGAVLPGALVTLSGANTGGRTTTSGTQGDFRFLNLDPGTYKLAVSMKGFGTVNREVVVTTGQNVNLSFALKVAGQSEEVTVTAETPVVDTKRVGTATTLTKEELAQVPQSRDPWAVLKTVPGVLVDRVNVAGNESGQQSGFSSKGSLQSDTQWNLDGVVITDVNSNGASSSYYDFDAFEEINVTTGGGDLKVQTGGIGINFVTKRGTNAFHGSARGFLANHKLQSTNLPGELDGKISAIPGPGLSDNANHTEQIFDWGAEISGPLVKDRLWFWGAYGKNDIRIQRLNQLRDKTLLKNWNAKLNWQASKNDMVSALWFNGAKVKLGRDPGVVGNPSQSFLWNQGNFYPEEGCGISCGLHGLWKLEWNHTFGPNFYLNAKYAYYGWGYGFAPIGGADQSGGADFDADRAYGSYITNTYRKPWQNVYLDGNYFKSGMGGNHEFKFGFSYRKMPSRTTTTYSGNQVFGQKQNATESFALVERQRNVRFTEKVASGYIGDTLTKGRFALNLGARYDHQYAFNESSTATANPLFPDLLPALQYDASSTPTITWNDISPRVSATLALDESRKTVARVSYARYAGQLFPNDVTTINPVGGYYTYLAYKWVDRNNDHLVTKDEILLSDGIQYYNNVDPAHPTSAVSPNKIASDYHSSKDNEVVVGIDRELGGNVAIGAAYTWRKVTDIPGWSARIGMTQANYTALPAVSANGYTAIAYAPNTALVAASNSGRILENRPDYSTGYSGIELTLNKRLSNKWFGRAALSYMDWHENILGPGAAQNPTRTDTTGSQSGATQTARAGPLVNGGQIAPKSGGSGKGDIFYNSRWQAVVNGLYQLPGNFEIGTSIFARQGYVYPVYLRISAGNDGAQRVLATPNIDDKRYDTVWTADFRLANKVKLGRSSADITLDLFNAFNNNMILGRNRQANASAFGTPTDVLSPRILRLGLRLNF